MTVSDKNMKRAGPWPAGVNNVAQEAEVPADALRKALNIDLSDEGNPRRRRGYTSILSGTNIRSLYGSGEFIIFAEGGSLKRLFKDDTSSTLTTGLDEDNPLDYAEVNNIIYCTDSTTNRKITLAGAVSELGLPVPRNSVILAAQSTGALDGGMYQVAITQVNADGEESGAGLASAVTVADGGGIVASGLTLSGDAVATNVYVTKANGDTFYFYNQTTAASITIQKTALQKVLETQFMEQLPAGQIMFYFKGRMWVADGEVLWYSQPLRYGLCDLSTDFFQFPERITVAIPVLDGVYVVADKTYFLLGTDPKQMQQLVVSPDKAVEGTGMLLKPDVFNLEDVVEDTAYWFSSRGAMLGLPGGRVQGLMEDKVAVPDYLSGATMLRAEEGIQQVVTAVKDPGEGSPMAIGDTASAEVVRNGITLT